MGGEHASATNALKTSQLRAVFQADDVNIEAVLIEAFSRLDYLPLGTGVESYSVGQKTDADASTTLWHSHLGGHSPARIYAGF